MATMAWEWLSVVALCGILQVKCVAAANNDYAEQTQPPELIGPLLDQGSFRDHPNNFYFLCRVHYDRNNYAARFRVEFFFDDDPSRVVADGILMTPNDQWSVGKDIWRGHVGHSLGCRVTALSTNPNARPPTLYSKTYKGEIRISESVVLTEGNHATINVTSTLPIVCECPGSYYCEMSVDFRPESTSLLTVDSPCQAALSPESWNPVTRLARATINLTTVVDHIQRTDQHYMVSYDLINRQGCGNTKMAPSIWDGYHLGTTNVTVIDEGFKHCHQWGDPHITNFEDSKTNLYQEGDYRMHLSEVNRFIFEVQQRHIYTDPKKTASHICGIVARLADKNTGIEELVTINVCKKDPPDLKNNQHDKLINFFTETLHDTSKVQYKITAITGQYMVVTVDGETVLTTDLYVPPRLVDKPGAAVCAEGIHKGGGELLSKKEADTLEMKPGDDLFKTRVMTGKSSGRRQAARKDAINFCSCPANGNSSGIICSPFLHRFDKTKSSEGWSAVDPQFDPEFPELIFDNGTVVPDRDLRNFSWPSDSGITEQEAIDHCQDLLKNYTNPKCVQKLNINVAYFIKSCTDDVLISDSYYFSESMLSAYKSKCRTEAMKSIDNYVNTNNGGLQLAPDYHSWCPARCSGHGQCVQGKCVCDKDYYRDDCGMQMAPPFIQPRSSTLCDSRSSDCHIIGLNTKNLDREHARNYVCQIAFLKDDGAGHYVPDLQDSQATVKLNFRNEYYSICDFSSVISLVNSTDQAAFGYQLTVTPSDGLSNESSNPVTFFVQDSKCKTCSANPDGNGFTCSNKDGTCHIDGRCWIKGEGDGSERVCDPAKSSLEWYNTRTGQLDSSLRPRLHGPVVEYDPFHNANNFRFYCYIPRDPDRPKAEYDVEFFFDDFSSPIREPRRTPANPPSVDKSAWIGHLGDKLACRVTEISQDPQYHPVTRTSNAYKGEVTVTESVSFKDNEHPAITLTSSLPPICECSTAITCGGANFQLRTQTQDLMDTACQITLTSADWNDANKKASATIKLSKVADHVQRSDPSYQISYAPTFEPSCYGFENVTPSLWRNYVYSTTKVDGVKDGRLRCSR